MIDLAKHIETLLLENDCVIVPNLGGFIAYDQTSYYDEAQNKFLPPVRTIGFNPQLAMNDGLLVQSYMQVYQTDFPDATRIIQHEVNQLKDTLYKEGNIELENIGRLTYDLKSRYTFYPTQKEILAPSLYGLPSLSLDILPTVSEAKHSIQIPATLPVKKKSKPTAWIGHVAAAAVAIILFFTLSAPVENTYIENGNYAALGTSALFEAIRSQSLATTVQSDQQKKEAVIPANLRPVATRVETVAPKKEEKKEEPKTNEVKSEKKIEKAPTAKPVAATTATKPAKPTTAASKPSELKSKYHIIIASLTTLEEAKRSVETFQKKGYKDASIVEGGGRYRLSIANSTEISAAYAKVKELKDSGAFKDAWVLTTE